MRVLALETATDFTGVAVVGDSRHHERGETAEIIINSSREKGNRIMVFIDRLLRDVNLELKDIDLLAVGIGPGLYTGMRSGISIMKGISVSTGKPLAGISTLDTIACNFLGCREKIVVLLNAYGGEIYGAVYGAGVDIKQDNNYFVGQIKDFLKKIKGKAIFAGTGVKIYQKEIRDILGRQAIFSPEESWIPRPLSLARLAIERFKKRRLPHPDRILPLYLKKSEAERKWKSSRSRL